VARPDVLSARADSSRLSHAWLDGVAAFDRGDIDELGRLDAALAAARSGRSRTTSSRRYRTRPLAITGRGYRTCGQHVLGAFGTSRGLASE
jgi:hypothetical protein